MKPLFDQAMVWIYRAEGLWSDDTSDPGGATRFGISLRYLRVKGLDFNADGLTDASDVRALSRDQAADLYRVDYWRPCRCAEMPAPIAVALFDAAVNTGVNTAVGLLQRSVAARVDGIVGSKTLESIATASADGRTHRVLAEYLGARAAYYHRLAMRRNALRRFAPGWFNRLHRLHSFIHTELQG